MGKYLTQEMFLARARKAHGDKYDYSKVVYQGKDKKVLIICPEHGEFLQEANSHMRGAGCPVCGAENRVKSRPNTRKTTDWFIEKARRVHGDKYDYSKSVYVNWETKVCITCPVHGDFYMRPGHHFEGQGCSYCTSRHTHLTEFIDKAHEKHGDKYDYSKVSFENISQKICIICPEHGEFYQRATSHLCGYGCPICAQRKRQETCLVRYGVSVPFITPESRAKAKVSVLAKYGVDNVSKLQVVRDKIFRTKALHGTFSTSKPAERIGEVLRNIFGTSNVKSEYDEDPRYPFHCDFYVQTRNGIFIEVNIFKSHGGHFFDIESAEDLSMLSFWQERAVDSKFYANAVHVWTGSDVRKRDAARLGELNYLTFWKSDLSDFYEWVDAGCPDGRDWIREYSWKTQA